MKLKKYLAFSCLIASFSGIAQHHTEGRLSKDTYLMDNNKTIALVDGVFFDDGGESKNVSNKHIITTFSSKDGMLELYFTDFNIPYDALLKIYDGTSVNGGLLGVFKSSDKLWNFKAKNITIEFIPSKSNAQGRGWRGVLRQSNVSKNPTVQSAPESDCPNAIPLCANNTVIVSASQYVDLGSINDDSGGCYSGTGSGGSVWYSFTPQATGPLDFLIVPAGSTDYDFVLWDITGGCGSKSEVLCNYSATHGSTGAASSGASASEGSSGSLLCTRPTVTIGHQYALCINFYGGSNDGYTLQFKNEASSVAITDNIPPTITYVTGNGCTNTTIMDVYFSEWINCATLQAADFTMPGHTFTMVNDFCSGGKTNHVQIGVSPALTAVAGTPSSYTLSVLNTGAGTSMNDMCGNPMNINYVVTLGVAPLANAGPDKYNCKSPGLFGIGYNYSSVTLNGSGGNAGSIYNWSDGSTGQSPSVSPTQTTTYTLTVTQGACTATDAVTVFTETAPTVNLGPDILMCSGLPLTLNASGGGTYQWQVQSGTVPFFGTPTFSTIPGATASSYSTTPVQYGSTGSTYYQVNVTSPNGGCTVTDQIKITFGSGSFGVLSSKPFLCAGETTTLSLPTGMTAYTWNTGTSPNAPLVVSPGTTTSYTATSTTAGCTGTAVVTVPVRPLPVVIASASPSVICAGNTATLSAAPTGSNVTITEDFETANSFTLVNGANNKWYWGTAAFAAGTKGLYIGTAAANNNYDIGNFITPKTATNHAYRDYAVNSFCTSNLSFKWKCNGQAAQAELTVWLVPNTFVPAAGTAITAGGGNVLLGGPYSGQTTYQNVTLSLAPYAGQTARIVFQWVNTGAAIIGGPTVANPAASIDDVVFNESLSYSYNWSSSPAGLGATSQSLTVSPSVVTAYSVTVTRCDGCVNSGAVPLSILPAATALTISPTSTTCPGQSVTLSVSGGSSYTWTPTASIVGSNTLSTITVTPGVTTIYTVTSPNCSGVQTKTVEVVVNGSLNVSVAPLSVSICPGSTVALTATGATNYTWSPSASLSSATGTTVISNAATTTTYTVVGSNASSCQGTNTVVVNVNAVPATTASVGGTVTCTTNTVNLNSTLAGMNYTWTAPAGSSVTSGVNSQNAIGNGVGIYTLSIVNSGGCTFSTTATVTSDLSAPVGVSAGASQTLSCSSTSVALNGSYTSPSGSTVSWLGGVCGSATTLTTSACAAGTYTLVIQHPTTGCTTTSTVQIFPNAGAPSLTVTPVSNSITCTNTLIPISVTSTTTPISINWGGPGIVGSTTASSINVNQGGVYTVTLTNTSSSCTTVFNVTVPTNTTPVNPSITGGLAITCSSPNTTLTANPSGGNYTYSWTGAGITSALNNAAVNVNAGGTYSVVVTNSTNGCTGSASVQVTASGSVPTATISTTSTNTIITCTNTNVGLTVNSTPSTGMSYAWSTGSNAQSINVSTGGVITVTVQNTSSGCYAIAQYTVNINTTAPAINAFDQVIPCGSNSVTLVGYSTPSNVTYNWTTSGTGSILSGANTASAVAGSTGQYVLTVTLNNTGCSTTQTVNVTSGAGISPSFTANPVSGTAPLLVNFTNQTTGTGNIYSWNFGDPNSSSNTSSLTNPDHTYNTTGTYSVVLMVTNASGLCSGTTTVTIEVLENSSLIVPNVFTPNGDGKNDIFKIISTGIKDLQCDIFNRWGTKIYSFSSPSGSWDGNNATDGTYFYILKCTGIDGKEYNLQGYLNLFR